MSAKKITINGKRIGDGEPLYYIADVGANHDGDFERALKLIELAKEAGASAVKFQNFQAKTIVGKRGFEALGGQLSHQASWKKPVFDVYQDASLSLEWTANLKEKCAEAGVDYFTSPYALDLIDAVDPYVCAYKIGSGDITWLEIIDYMAEKGKPIMLATGASSLEDVKRAMEHILKRTKDVVLMQCNTNYTADVKNFHYINLNVLKEYAKLYPDVVLGLSDHTLGHSTVVGSVALGARVFEKHFTDDNSRIGPDHKFAMNPKTWREMVTAADEVYAALGDGVKRVEENEKQTAVVQRRALAFTGDFSRGHVVISDDLFPLRPIPPGALAPYEVDSVIGRPLMRDVHEGEYVRREDLA